MNAIATQAAFANWLCSSPPRFADGSAFPFAGIAASRLAIHRNTFVATLTAALGSAFPVTKALAGEDFFNGLARQRILADPPRSPRVSEFAGDFPLFVASSPAAMAFPVLAEMARLEELRLQSYHAADATPVSLECFQAICAAPEQLLHAGVRLHPSARWHRSPIAIHQLWAAHQDVADVFAVDLGGIDARQAEDVLVVRPDLDVVVVLLPCGACDFLDALCAGSALDVAMMRAREASPAADPMALFSLLVRHGLAIALFDTRQEQP